ncbi:extracellular serine-threonine rich protein [Rutstroemia sp. NJR-2017a BBW]|nr:extracellular serine-threonine rich protein [Rutstroemia sp. NJR-2017a BBW]
MFPKSLGTALLGAALATNVIAQDASLATRHSSGTSLCSHDIGCSRQKSVMIDTRADVELDVFGLLSLGGSVGVEIGAATGVKIECVDCRTWGTAVITNTVATIENNLLEGLVSILTNPAELVREYAQLEALISLENVGGHIELDIFAAEAATYTFNVFEAGLISDIEILSIIDLGINVFLDLVISVEAGLDLSAGFEFSFPEGASFVVDLLSGVISNHDFTGAVMNDLPIIVLAGEAELKAALRMRVEVGTKLTLPIASVGFEFAAFADLLEYSTVIATTDSCPLHISGGVDVSLGAIAQLAADLDFASFSLAPSAVVNILNVDLPVICTTRPATTTPLARLGSGSGSATTVISGASTMVTSIVVSDLPSASVPGVSAALPTGSLPDASGSIIGITSPSDVSVSGAPIPSAGSVTGPFANGTLPSSTGADSGLESNPTITSAASLTTSTVYATQVSTITSCAANVLHCPASMTGTTVVTQTVVQYTTVCPVAEAESSAALASAAGSTPLPAFTTTSSPVQVAPSSITPKVTLTPVAVTSTSTIQVASSAEGVAITPAAGSASVTGSSPSVGSSASASSPAQGSGSAPASSAVTDSGVVGSSPSSVVASSLLASSSAASVSASGNSGSSGSVVSSAVSSPLASSPAAGNSGSSGSVVSSAVSSPVASSPASGSGNSGSSGNSSPVASSPSPEETSESSGLTLSSASPSVGASGSKSTVTSYSTGTLFQTSTVITHGYTTVTVVPVQSTGVAQPVSPAEGAGSSAGSVASSPASGSSSVAVGVSGSPASPSVVLSGSSQSEAGEVCAPTVTVTAAAYTITQTPSIITVYRTASASGVPAPADVASSAVGVPGSSVSSSMSLLGLVISPSSASVAGESSAPVASAPAAFAPVASGPAASASVASGPAASVPVASAPAGSATGMYPSIVTGIIAATGSPSVPAGVAPGSPAPTGALYPIGANNGTAAFPSGSGIPVKPTSITGPVRSFASEPSNAATTGAVPTSLMVATGGAGRVGVSMAMVAGVMGLVALL